MNTDHGGRIWHYYLKRAILAQQGLGANVVEDAIYPLNLADESGKPLDGAHKYTITSRRAPPRRSMLSGRSRFTIKKDSRSVTP